MQRRDNLVYCQWEEDEVIGGIVARIIASTSGHEKARTVFNGTSGSFSDVPLLPGEEYIVFVGSSTTRITVPSKFDHMIT